MLKTLSEKTRIANVSLMLSSVCVLHCLLTPFFILLLPALAEFFSEALETVLVLAVAPLALIGFLPSWLKHKNYRLLRIFILGLTLVVFSQFFMHIEHDTLALSSGAVFTGSFFKTLLMFLGAGLLAYSVYKNNKHTHVCNHQH